MPAPNTDYDDLRLIVKALRAVVDSLEQNGFPKRVMVVGSDICRQNLQFHLTLWRKSGEGGTTTYIEQATQL